jgi:hypothetical protein
MTARVYYLISLEKEQPMIAQAIQGKRPSQTFATIIETAHQRIVPDTYSDKEFGIN